MASGLAFDWKQTLVRVYEPAAAPTKEGAAIASAKHSGRLDANRVRSGQCTDGNCPCAGARSERTKLTRNWAAVDKELNGDFGTMPGTGREVRC